MWAEAGPAGVDVETGRSAAAAEGSWGYCAGLVTHWGPYVAAGATSGGALVGPEKVGVHFVQIEGPGVAAEGLLHPLHLDLHHPLAGQPWYVAAAAASGDDAVVEASVGVPAAGPQSLGSLAPAGPVDHQAAGDQEADLQEDPVPQWEAASPAVPWIPGPVVAVVAETDHD